MMLRNCCENVRTGDLVTLCIYVLDCNGGFRRGSVRSECDKELSDSRPRPDLRLPNPDSQRARQIADDYRSVIHANILCAYKSLVYHCSIVLFNSVC